MWLHPRKCVFGLDSGKILVFLVLHQGIEEKIKKIDTIINMPPRKNIFQLHNLQGKVQAIRRFVSLLEDKNILFTQLLNKDSHFK